MLESGSGVWILNASLLMSISIVDKSPALMLSSNNPHKAIITDECLSMPPLNLYLMLSS